MSRQNISWQLYSCIKTMFFRCVLCCHGRITRQAHPVCLLSLHEAIWTKTLSSVCNFIPSHTHMSSDSEYSPVLPVAPPNLPCDDWVQGHLESRLLLVLVLMRAWQSLPCEVYSPASLPIWTSLRCLLPALRSMWTLGLRSSSSFCSVSSC